jgi:aromatic ring-opening dioxygenase catalytic subunit (LigB family)
MSTSSILDPTKPKSPIYFFSHGGPTFMYEDSAFGGDKGAFRATSKIGKFIKDQIKPNFIIVVSAHWESDFPNIIEVAVPKSNSVLKPGLLSPLENELIYDFYGFPQHMYHDKFHSEVNLELANDIKDSLINSGITSKLTNRGIDHGVWVPCKVAFSTNKAPDAEWDLDIPLVQVSLSRTEDFGFHHKLGEVLSKYRELGGVVICSGMTVHNLRDLGAAQMGRSLPYVPKFNKALTEILVNNEDNTKRLELLNNIKLNNRDLLYKAHPTLEHFMPVVVASGGSNFEKVKEIYNNEDGSLAWGIYQFGEWNSTTA